MAGTLSAREAAIAVGVSERTIRNWIAAGKLPAERTEAGFRVRPEDLPEIAPRPGTQYPADAGNNGRVLEIAAALSDLVALVERLQRQNMELAGLVGSLQQRLVFAEDQIHALQASKEPDTSLDAPGRDSGGDAVEPPQQSTERTRPWWRFW